LSDHLSSTKRASLTETSPFRAWSLVFLAAAAALPSLFLRVSGVHLAPEITALVSGVAVLGAAFLLSWSLEVAQLHISASLAIAILALIAILPEYAVEAVLAWEAGQAWTVGADPAAVPEVARVAANVTGANRLLIGVGWSMVAVVFWLKQRRELVLTQELSLEFTILMVATLLTFLIFFLQAVTLYLSAILIGLYIFYLWVSSRMPSHAGHLIGPSEVIGRLPLKPQLTIIIALFFYAALTILVAAEPFVHGLIESGVKFGIPEFTLIQWLAPLASESPELVIALLLTLRSNAVGGMTALISSGVNQLTLLVGCMPIVFSLSFGQATDFPLDHQQAVEFLLTASLALFAVGLIARLRVPWYGAIVLLGLFIAHLFFLGPDSRLIFSFIYLGLAAVLLIADRGRIVEMYRRAMTVFSPNASRRDYRT
jgi:cation:H+ antiporter